jgi:hypothetical protein
MSDWGVIKSFTLKRILKMRLLKPWFFLISTPILLVGCGGGDGGSDSSTTLNATPVAITASNGQTIAGQTVDTFEDVANSQSASTELVTGVGVSEGGSFSLLNTIQKLAGHELFPTFKDAVTGLSITVNCSGGGTASGNLSGNDNDLDEGDVLTYTLSNCSEEGVVLNGSIVFSFNTLQGDFENKSTDWAMVISFQADSFSAIGDNQNYTLDGDFTLSVSYVQSSGISTVSIQGSQLTYIESTDIAQLSNFVLTVTEDRAIPSNYTVNYNFTYTGSDIGGRVIADTIQDFVGLGENPPESGKAKITGANGSNVVIEATGAGMVKLSIDANGDGDFNDPGDTIITGQWDNVFSE